MLIHSSKWSAAIKKQQIRELCEMILDETIHDEDKYQTGLTKIFFRAGMLALLESRRSDKLNALVTIVQKNMRRRMAVKKYQRMRVAAIRIQTWWRQVMAVRLVDKIRKEVAAIRLQKAVRRFVRRREFLQVHNAVTGMQSRAFMMRRDLFLTVSQVYVDCSLVGHLRMLVSRSLQFDCRAFSEACEFFPFIVA